MPPGARARSGPVSDAMPAFDDAALPDLAYKVRWRVPGARPGSHRGRQNGSGGELRGYVPFWSSPDTRRIDFARSAKEPDGTLMVRQIEQRSAIDVYVIADLSASMDPTEDGARRAEIAKLVKVLSQSARRSGDAFGFIGFGETVMRDDLLKASRVRGAEQAVLERLQTEPLTARNINGLKDVAAYLGTRRRLVLLVSDFHAPRSVLEPSLAALGRHDIVPIVLRDRRERELPSGFGFIHVRDVETGQPRSLLLRPALRRRWSQAAAENMRMLGQLLSTYGRPPFFAWDRINYERLSEHLLAG
ncbi:Hypothetical protein GbCGDNIH7_0349 [Granulibacter bethesdensis]|nr:Hypothetical protein GbCGDNIH4_0349 [Granulibacter bethesdensis CGDNIH4]APH58657.1 Hypothetical protein GbCGDNIH7_0349 [Granulibacter bethesdensis]